MLVTRVRLPACAGKDSVVLRWENDEEAESKACAPGLEGPRPMQSSASEFRNPGTLANAYLWKRVTALSSFEHAVN